MTRMSREWMFLATLTLVGCGGMGPGDPGYNFSAQSGAERHDNGDDDDSAPPQELRNPTGRLRTISTTGSIDTSNPFFQSLGTNGRTCASCHVQENGWGISTAKVNELFERSNGLDPLFRTVDGANSPTANISTEGSRRQAFSMLRKYGVIRVGIGIPANAEFELVAVDDPWHYASANELSLFRRPLPSVNLNLSAIMWDGRETVGEDIHQGLKNQSNDATVGHAQGQPLTDAQREQIVQFETSLFDAQSFDDDVGDLTAEGAHGGPEALAAQDFYIGINDPLGGNPTGAAFDLRAFTLYDAWKNIPGNGRRPSARRAVARGQEIFNTKPIFISGVRGLNDTLGAPVIQGTCTLCHDSPNVGDHSVVMPLDIGLTDEAHRKDGMPLYTLKRKSTGEIIKTTDPGRALLTGKWNDVSRFKGPVLRGLAARAPYFHNGFAANLNEVVDFYNERFGMNLSAQEKSDLVAFLKTL